jgi:hypothetical protein
MLAKDDYMRIGNAYLLQSPRSPYLQRGQDRYITILCMIIKSYIIYISLSTMLIINEHPRGSLSPFSQAPTVIEWNVDYDDRKSEREEVSKVQRGSSSTASKS